MAYIVFKLLFLDLILEAITKFILVITGARRVSDVLVLWGGELVQDPTFKCLSKLRHIDYMKQEEFKKQIIKLYIESFYKIKSVTKKKVIIKTNTFIYKNVLVPLEEQGLIKIATGRTKLKRQPSEKLIFISTYYVWRHMLDSQFWKKVMRKEKVTKYVIELG